MSWEQAEHVGVTRAGRAVATLRGGARGGGGGGGGGLGVHGAHHGGRGGLDDDEDSPLPEAAPQLLPPPPSGGGGAAAASFKEDAALSRFPFSVVWTPLPLITWLLPFVGHLGIADSRGVIYDFAGPFTIGVDSFAFGAPVRVLRLRPERAAAASVAAASAAAASSAAAEGVAAGPGGGAGGESAAQVWDRCVDSGCDTYVGRMHVMLYDDCHDHVARCLNEMRYGGHARWNKVTLAAWIFFAGAFVSPRRTLAAYGPAVVIWAVIALLLRGAAR